MPTETLQPKRELEVYPRVHKAGVRSINQMEVRATGGQRRGFPPEAGVRVSYGPGFLLILDLGCMFEGRDGAGQGALGLEAGRTADRGAGEGQAPKEQGDQSTHHNPPMVLMGSSESILRDFGIRMGSDTTQQPQ